MLVLAMKIVDICLNSKFEQTLSAWIKIFRVYSHLIHTLLVNEFSMVIVETSRLHALID